MPDPAVSPKVASPEGPFWGDGGALSSRFEATGVVVGFWDADLSQLTLVDGTVCAATPAVKLRRWLEKHPEAIGGLSRWLVYPRPVEGGKLAFFVLGQRNPLPGETEQQINRQIDRFRFSGEVLNVRVKRQQLVLRIGRNLLPDEVMAAVRKDLAEKGTAAVPRLPRRLRHHPAWRTRTVFLAGTGGVPQGAVGKNVTVMCRRDGSLLRPFHWKVNKQLTSQPIPLGVVIEGEPLTLPWPWRPSSQSLHRLGRRWPLPPAELTGEADVDTGLLRHTLEQIIALHKVLALDLSPAPEKTTNPALSEKILSNTLQEHQRLHQWSNRLQEFLGTRSAAEREGMLRSSNLIPCLVSGLDALEGLVQVERTEKGIHLFLREGERLRPIRGAPRTKLLRLLGLHSPTPATAPEQPKDMPTPQETPNEDAPIPTEEQAHAFREKLKAIAEREGLPSSWVHLRLSHFIAGHYTIASNTKRTNS